MVVFSTSPALQTRLAGEAAEQNDGAKARGTAPKQPTRDLARTLNSTANRV
jgi:hypothetical protein